MEITARFMAALLGLHDDWSTYHAGFCLQRPLYALNLVLNGKFHSLEILIIRQSHYVFACTKQKNLHWCLSSNHRMVWSGRDLI